MRIPAVNVNFVGMSLYFFVVDFVRAAFSLPEDSQLSIEELKSYGRAFCALDWEFHPLVGSLRFRDVQKRFSGVHAYTNAQVLPQRCFQVGLRGEWHVDRVRGDIAGAGISIGGRGAERGDDRFFEEDQRRKRRLDVRSSIIHGGRMEGSRV